VRVTNRGDCCGERLNGFDIWTDGGRKCASNVFVGQGRTLEVACVATTRRVKIQLPRSGMLTLCEVEVKGESKTRRLTPAEAGLENISSVSTNLAGVSNTASTELAAWESVADQRMAGAHPTLPSMGDEQPQDGRSPQRVHSPTHTVEASEGSPGRSLSVASDGGYVKNIGKAMYGYNHYLGAPASSMSAGTDPGFVHRPIWKTSYTKAAAALTKYFSEIPRDAGMYDEFRRASGYLEKCSGSRYGIAKGQENCKALSSCQGLTCNPDGCQICTSSDLRPTSAGSVSYLKKTGSRRLAAGNMSSSMYVYGPERRLTASVKDDGFLKIPDGWQVTVAARTICDKDFQTEQVQTDFDYEKQTTKNLNPMGFKLDLGQYSFSMSHEKKEFHNSNSKYKKKMYQTTAECLEYIAEIPDLANNPPPTDESFEFVIIAASEEEDYYSIFDMYGLHFPTKLYFGAKYGFTQMIDKSSWSTLKSTSSSFSVGAEVTKGIKLKKGISPQLGLSATVGASYGSKSSREQAAKFESHFSETKEFSLGRRMPNSGGVHEWVKLIGGEPMPTRWGLESLCEHPAFATKKSACVRYSKSYCEKHLAHADPDATCDVAQRRECTWDLDCLPRHTCTVDGKCEKLPSCTVELYDYAYFNGGSPRVLGPVYYTDAAGGPDGGKMFDVEDKHKIGSAKVSEGCEKVVLVDQDSCKLSSRDNLVLGRSANAFEHKDFWDDLENDICEVKVLARKDWID